MIQRGQYRYNANESRISDNKSKRSETLETALIAIDDWMPNALFC